MVVAQYKSQNQLPPSVGAQCAAILVRANPNRFARIGNDFRPARRFRRVIDDVIVWCVISHVAIARSTVCAVKISRCSSACRGVGFIDTHNRRCRPRGCVRCTGGFWFHRTPDSAQISVCVVGASATCTAICFRRPASAIHSNIVMRKTSSRAAGRDSRRLFSRWPRPLSLGRGGAGVTGAIWAVVGGNGGRSFVGFEGVASYRYWIGGFRCRGDVSGGLVHFACFAIHRGRPLLLTLAFADLDSATSRCVASNKRRHSVVAAQENVNLEKET